MVLKSRQRSLHIWHIGCPYLPHSCSTLSAGQINCSWLVQAIQPAIICLDFGPGDIYLSFAKLVCRFVQRGAGLIIQWQGLLWVQPPPCVSCWQAHFPVPQHNRGNYTADLPQQWCCQWCIPWARAMIWERLWMASSLLKRPQIFHSWNPWDHLSSVRLYLARPSLPGKGSVLGQGWRRQCFGRRSQRVLRLLSQHLPYSFANLCRVFRGHIRKLHVSYYVV